MHLTEEQIAITDMAKDFALAHLWPYAPKWDKNEEFPIEALKQAASLGLAGMFVSNDSGGSGLSRLDGALIFEQLATGCVSTSAFLSIHNMVACMIDKYAKAEIKKQYLPKLASMDLIGSYCLTEPQSGSDAASLKTTAIDKGEYYLVNGQKAFISGAGRSDIYVTMVRTSEARYKGISCLLIPKELSGMRFGAPEHKMGWRNQPTAMVYFEDCKVPKNHLLGDEGLGFKYALDALNGGRINIAACALGGALKAMRLTQTYMQERKQFDKALKDIQALRFYFSQMLIDYEASKFLLLNAARSYDEQALSAPRSCAIAKKFVTEHASKILKTAIQLHGGYGYLHDYHVERIYRDIRVHEILEGTNEIMQEIIAKSVFEDELAW